MLVGVCAVRVLSSLINIFIYLIAVHCVSKTAFLRLIWHNFTCSQHSLIIFGRGRLFQFSVDYGKVKLAWNQLGAFRNSDLTRGDWKCENGKRGTVKNAGVETATMENVAPVCRGWKMLHRMLWNAENAITNKTVKWIINTRWRKQVSK